MSFNSWALRVGDDGADSVVVEEMGVETPDCTLAVIFEESRSRELARIMFYARRGRTTKFAQNGVMSARDVDETNQRSILILGARGRGSRGRKRLREEEAAGGREVGHLKNTNSKVLNILIRQTARERTVIWCLARGANWRVP